MSCTPIQDFSLITLNDAGKVGTPGKLYSIVPDTGDGDFDVTRATASGMRRVNAQGQYEAVAAGMPIINFDIITKQYLGTYVRGQFVNRWRNSEADTAPTGAGATSTGVLFEPNDWGLGLSGKAIFEDASITRTYYDTNNLSNAGGITIGFFAKKSGGGKPTFQSFTQNSGTCDLFIAAGGSGTGTATEVFAQLIKDDVWFLCYNITSIQDFNAQSHGFTTVRLSGSATLSGVRVEISGITYINNAQITLTPYDYIATFGSTVTRDADVITRTNAADLIGQTEGTVVLDLDFRATSETRGIFSLQSTANDNMIELIMLSNNGLRVRTLRNQPPPILANNISSTSPQTSGRLKIAFAYADEDYALSINGDTPITSSIANVLPDGNLSIINLFAARTAALLDGHVKLIAIQKTRVSNAKLQELSQL